MRIENISTTNITRVRMHHYFMGLEPLTIGYNPWTGLSTIRNLDRKQVRGLFESGLLRKQTIKFRIREDLCE